MMSAADDGSTCISADFQELVLAVSMAHKPIRRHPLSSRSQVPLQPWYFCAAIPCSSPLSCRSLLANAAACLLPAL